MNREIKFRAWDKINHKIISDIEVIQFNPIKVGFIDIGTDDGETAYQFQNLLQDDEFDLMQFTGLSDKNGKEIYEGDVIKWGHVKDYEEHPVRVAEIKMPIGQIEFHSQIGIFYFSGFVYRNSLDKCSEIIGNVFQNPELLK